MNDTKELLIVQEQVGEIEEIESKPWHKSSDAEIANYIKTALDVIEANGSRNEVLNSLVKTYGLKRRAALNYYNRAMALVKEELTEEVKDVRNRRIKSLQKDMRIAYRNFEDSEKDADRNLWFKTYLDVKKLHDSYFPNSLKPETIDDSNMNITLSYSNTKPSNE
jgi:hypothetical protein